MREAEAPRAAAADDEPDVGVIAGDARIGADEDVVQDRDVIGATGEVELGAASLVDAEPVRLDP